MIPAYRIKVFTFISISIGFFSIRDRGRGNWLSEVEYELHQFVHTKNDRFLDPYVKSKFFIDVGKQICNNI